MDCPSVGEHLPESGRGFAVQVSELEPPLAPKPWPVQRLSAGPDPEHARRMPDLPIERAEVVALLFNVSDISVTLTNIERLLGDNDGEEETHED